MLNRIKNAAQLPAHLIVGRGVSKIFGYEVEQYFHDLVAMIPDNVRVPVARPLELSEEKISEVVETLRLDGIYLWESFFSSEQMEMIRKDIEAEFDKPEHGIIKLGGSGIFYVTHQPLSMSRELSKGVINPDLLEVCHRFFRRGPFLTKTDFRRVLPIPGDGNQDIFKDISDLGQISRLPPQWHHDIRGNQIKIQVYLTDVGPNDHYFSYIKGSHKGFKRASVAQSKFSPEDVQRMDGDELKCFGRAGTAALFVTNGVHRLNRQGGSAVRDTVTYNYHPHRMPNAMEQDIFPDVLAEYPEQFQSFSLVAHS